MATQRIQLKRGNTANLPNSGLLIGEPLVTLDRGNLHIATSATTKLPVTPAIDLLATMPAITTSDDYLLIHDADEATPGAQKEKKVTVDALKAALNIPASSTDEKVSAITGGVAGSLAGSDGTNGVLRMGSSMAYTIDPSNNFVTIDVTTVDGGTF
jgi:hypothetical protein